MSDPKQPIHAEPGRRHIEAKSLQEFYDKLNELPEDPGPGHDGPCDLFKKTYDNGIVAPRCRGKCDNGAKCQIRYSVGPHFIKVQCDC